MAVFSLIVIKLLPLYGLIALGYFAGKRLYVQKDSIAMLLLYIIVPVVLFHGAITADLNLGLVFLPVILFSIGSVVCLATYLLARDWWNDATKNILAFAAGTGNTGYFGLPVALLLFGEEALSIVVFATMGIVLFENTLGFFITARGHHTAREGLVKLLKLPTIYAFAAGIILNLLHTPLHPLYVEFATYFRGAYSVLGMMLVGLGMSSVTRLAIDYRFLLTSVINKFFVWPALGLAVVWFDTHYLHVLNELSQHVLLLLTCVPLAANTVSFATVLKAHPEKAALAVVTSTLLALLFVPLYVSWLL